MGEIAEITDRIARFRDEREWVQFHTHKDLAISLVLEASELLEHFQWKNEAEVDRHVRERLPAIEEELADVAIYLFELSANLGVELAAAIDRKLAKNAVKYPVEKAKGSNRKAGDW